MVAIGHPLGLSDTVSDGLISAVRQVDESLEVLQISAPIAPGSSGGPLVTLAGAWVGVNVAGVPGASGIGFTIPSHQAEEFLEDVVAGRGIESDRRR